MTLKEYIDSKRKTPFKYVDVIRNKKGKLRPWEQHDKLAKQQFALDKHQDLK